MAKLVVIDGQVCVVSGRLVTDKDGAPCCCGPGNPCACDLMNPRTAYRWACGPFRNVPILSGALFGTMFMDVQWSARSTWTSPTQSEQKTAQGRGLLCFGRTEMLALDGSFARGNISVRDANGSGGRSYEAVPDATQMWWGLGPAGYRTDLGRLSLLEFVNLRGGFGGINAFITTARTIWNGGALCSAMPGQGGPCTFSECPPNSGFCRSFDFTDSDTGGQATGRANVFPLNPNGATGDAEINVTWTRDLSCRIGGSGALPLGIDPTTLRPHKTGCPGCGD
jgi:hypothetical protein